MASPEAEAIKDAIRAFRATVVAQDQTVDEQRTAANAGMSAMTTEPDGIAYEPAVAGGVPGQWVLPDGFDGDRTILYLHGGGYVIGNSDSHRKMVGHLAKAATARALVLDYRLAPEHPHPAAVEDAVAAYQSILADGHDAANVFIAGDSAGGGLTAATLVSLRDQGIALPAGAFLLSPWTDLEGTGESMTANAEADLMVGMDGLKPMSDAYLQGQDPRQPTAAPLYADLTGLPPLLIHVGGDETLLDDSTRLALSAQGVGVDATIEVFPEMQHVFQLSAGNMPEADDSLARAGAWIAARSAGA